eukprot:TCONS_00028516-protein
MDHLHGREWHGGDRVTAQKFNQLKKCGLLPANAVPTLQDQPAKVTPSSKSLATSQQLITFTDKNGAELTVTSKKFNQLKKCGLLPANAVPTLQDQPAKVTPSSKSLATSQQLITFTDKNGAELTVTSKKFNQLKKCGLLPANAVPTLQDQPAKVTPSSKSLATSQQLITFTDKNGAEVTVTSKKFNQLKECGLLPQNAILPLQDRPAKVTPRSKSQATSQQLITFTDKNGVELTVTSKKFNQLKECGLLPHNAIPPLQDLSTRVGPASQNVSSSVTEEYIELNQHEENKSEDAKSLQALP